MSACPTCGHESAPIDGDRAVLLMRIVRTWQDRQTVAEQMFAEALAAERERARAPFRELGDTYAFLGATLHDVPRAETYAEVAREIRAAAKDAEW